MRRLAPDHCIPQQQHNQRYSTCQRQIKLNASIFPESQIHHTIRFQASLVLRIRHVVAMQLRRLKYTPRYVQIYNRPCHVQVSLFVDTTNFITIPLQRLKVHTVARSDMRVTVRFRDAVAPTDTQQEHAQGQGHCSDCSDYQHSWVC